MAIQHDLPLISTIAVGLTVAFVVGLAASKLRLSPIVGYLIAGIIVGPFTPGFVADGKLAEELSEIGIVLLMFGVGLHFSLKDLLQVKWIAVPGAIIQIAVATAMGAALATMWGWPLQNALLLGLALSVASTVVLLRALEEHNTLSSTNGQIAIGWLIVEDIFMILALVLIPPIATNFMQADGSGGVDAWLYPLLIAVAKIVLFFAFMLIGGKRFLPWLLNVVSRTRSREMFTLAVIVVAVGVAFGAAKLFGVSLALGAFFAGMMLKESDLSHEVADRALPFQDAFAVLFFVAVGMLFDPMILMLEPLRVLGLVLIVMVGKSAAAFFIVWICRYPLKTALMVSASLAQIGEFSFILASLGIAYNLLSQEGYSLILAAALISITLNPLTFHGSHLIYAIITRYEWLNRLFKPGEADLDHLTNEEKTSLKDDVILVGFGRVGKHICEEIKHTNIELVVIDANRERVETLRSKGLHAIAGDASHPETLREAAIDKAKAIIVAVPNPFEARKIVEAARLLKPEIEVLVRAANDVESDYFQQQNVTLSVMGTQEVARRMVEYLTART